MYSLNSSEAPADRRDTTIVDSFVRVAEVSYCAYAEPCDAARLAELHDALVEQCGGAPEYVRIAVTFSGDCYGHAIVHLPAVVAQDLVGSFVGAMPGEELPAHDVDDALGEFGNMVAGGWLTDAATRLNFALKPPQVSREPLGWSPVAALGAEDGEGTAFPVTLNDQPALVRMRLEALL
jgi:hypothetical protein